VHHRFEELGYDVRLLRHGDEPDAPVNVEAELTGTTRAGEAVVIAAHFDAFYAGADDNSSGVAALLELARIASERRFERTVRFVGFDLEERGSLGSTRYVEAGHANDVTATIVLECIGFADRSGDQDSPFGLQLGERADSLVIAANHDSRSMAELLFALNNSLQLLELRAVIAGGDGAYPLSGALLRSDNGPFWLKGLPAVMLTDSANYRNPHYHAESDIPETLDPELMAGTTRLVAAALAELAGVEP
jgi:Zn-dependent M28 family amino/carboxypeptidase